MYTDAYDMYSRLEQWGYAMKVSVTAVANMLGMMTVRAFMQYTSTPWKAFGPCCDRGLRPTSRRLTRQLAMVFGLLEFVPNVRRRGKAFVGSLLELLLT